jgi:hypothetical protein
MLAAGNPARLIHIKPQKVRGTGDAAGLGFRKELGIESLIVGYVCVVGHLVVYGPL